MSVDGNNDKVDREQIMFHLGSIEGTTKAMANKYISNSKAAKRILNELAEIRKLLGTTMVEEIERVSDSD